MLVKGTPAIAKVIKQYKFNLSSITLFIIIILILHYVHTVIMSCFESYIQSDKSIPYINKLCVAQSVTKQYKFSYIVGYFYPNTTLRWVGMMSCEQCTQPTAHCVIGNPCQIHYKHQSCKNFFIHNKFPYCLDVLKFCTEHGSHTAVLCAKFQIISTIDLVVMKEWDCMKFEFNSLWSCDGTWQLWSRSTLAQPMMACTWNNVDLSSVPPNYTHTRGISQETIWDLSHHSLKSSEN